MLASITGIRPTNCDVLVGAKERCPECGMHHLRPGYCAALDSLSDWPNTRLGKAWLAKHPRETDKPIVVETANLETANETANETDRPCSECGIIFTPKRADARFCSPACRLKAHRKDPLPADNSDEVTGEHLENIKQAGFDER